VPIKTYTLESDTTPYTIEISWKGTWQNVKVVRDFTEIGSFETKMDLFTGKDFTLPDGSTLRVQLEEQPMSVNLLVLHNGRRLASPDIDPKYQLKQAYTTVFVIGGIHLAIGLLFTVFEISFIRNDSQALLGIGLLFFVLGFFIMRESFIALGLALVILVLDGILSLVLIGRNDQSALPHATIVWLAMLVLMINSFNAIRVIKAERKDY